MPLAYCHIDTKFLTQAKFLGTYLVPKIDVQFGVTFQSAPGLEVVGNQNVTTAQTTPRLPSFAGAAVRPVNLVKPGTVYNDRANQLDVRLSKIVRMGRYRTSFNLDLANALNANYILGTNPTYGSTWLAPLAVMDPRSSS